MKKTFFPLLLLTGCVGFTGVANYQQNMAFQTYDDGHDVYHFGGYTDHDELSEADGKKYADKIMASVCPHGYVLERVTVEESHNVTGKFGKWRSQGYCTKRATDE